MNVPNGYQGLYYKINQLKEDIIPADKDRRKEEEKGKPVFQDPLNGYLTELPEKPKVLYLGNGEPFVEFLNQNGFDAQCFNFKDAEGKIENLVDILKCEKRSFDLILTSDFMTSYNESQNIMGTLYDGMPTHTVQGDFTDDVYKEASRKILDWCFDILKIHGYVISDLTNIGYKKRMVDRSMGIRPSFTLLNDTKGYRVVKSGDNGLSGILIRNATVDDYIELIVEPSAKKTKKN